MYTAVNVSIHIKISAFTAHILKGINIYAIICIRCIQSVNMSRIITFRINDDEIDALSKHQLEGESLNLVAARLVRNQLDLPVEETELSPAIEERFNQIQKRFEELEGKLIA